MKVCECLLHNVIAISEHKGYELNIMDKRRHHEIYLSDARKAAPEKLKTVIRHPIRERGVD